MISLKLLKLKLIAYNSLITEAQSTSIKLARVGWLVLFSKRSILILKIYVRTKYRTILFTLIIYNILRGIGHWTKNSIRKLATFMVIVFNDNLLAHKQRKFYGKYFSIAFFEIFLLYALSVTMWIDSKVSCYFCYK